MYGYRYKKNEPKDDVVEKIKEMYMNYGIDISDMSDEEFLRIKDKYTRRPEGSLDSDLKESRKYILTFSEEII